MPKQPLLEMNPGPFLCARDWFGKSDEAKDTSLDRIDGIINFFADLSGFR